MLPLNKIRCENKSVSVGIVWTCSHFDKNSRIDWVWIWIWRISDFIKWVWEWVC